MNVIDSIAFPRPDLMICPGDVLLCLRVTLRSCKNGDFICHVCSQTEKHFFTTCLDVKFRRSSRRN